MTGQKQFCGSDQGETRLLTEEEEREEEICFIETITVHCTLFENEKVIHFFMDVVSTQVHFPLKPLCFQLTHHTSSYTINSFDTFHRKASKLHFDGFLHPIKQLESH